MSKFFFTKFCTICTGKGRALPAIYPIFCGYALFLLCSFFLNGCATRGPIFRQMGPLPAGPVCRVAVLPFVNDSDYPLADTIVQKVFTTAFQGSGNYLVIQEGETHKIYQQLHILPQVAPSREKMEIIASRLNAQLLITGIILQAREDRGEHTTVNPMLLMKLDIRDGRSGEILWTVIHRRQGTDYKKSMHFGTIHTVTGLSRQMAVEIINLWFKKGLKQCDIFPQS